MNPYEYQLNLMRAVYEGKSACAVIHRRAGKDLTCVQLWLMRALQRVGTHIYLFPLQKQAREVIWNGMDFTGKPFISYIPESLVEKKSEARMELTLFNGSRMVLAGSNNFNAHMGTNPITIINSEFSLHNPLARQYLMPILIQNGGLEILQYTPRGMNHGYEVLEQVREDPDYFSCVLDVEHTFRHDGTRVVTEEMIERARRMGMSEETIKQEFYCDFEVGNVGAYFTRELALMKNEGRIISGLQINPNIPLNTCWDLGATDATAIWFFQINGQWLDLVHYHEDNNRSMKEMLEAAEKIRQEMGCQWGAHYGPHDIKQGHQGFETVESRLVQARRAGYFFKITPTVNFTDAVEQMRYVLGFARIHKERCRLGLQALREYARDYDEVKCIYSDKPAEGWYLHGADAFRYLALNYRRFYLQPQAQLSYRVSV